MPEAYATPQAQSSRTPQVPGQQPDMLLQCRGQTSPVLEDSHAKRILLLARQTAFLKGTCLHEGQSHSSHVCSF